MTTCLHIGHSTLKTLHSVECAALDAGLDRIQVGKAEAQSWVAYLADKFNVGIPRVSIKAMGWVTWGRYCHEGLICLNNKNGGDNLKTLAHEFAHHVAWTAYIGGTISSYIPHGAQFKMYFRKVIRFAISGLKVKTLKVSKPKIVKIPKPKSPIMKLTKAGKPDMRVKANRA